MRKPLVVIWKSLEKARNQPRINANERDSEIKSENGEAYLQQGDQKPITRIYFFLRPLRSAFIRANPRLISN